MKTVDSGIDDQSHLNIEFNGDSFSVTGVSRTVSSTVTLKPEEMEAIKNLTLCQARFFPKTALQKVFVITHLGDPWEQWWNFITAFGEQFTVKVYCKDFQATWKEMHQ